MPMITDAVSETMVRRDMTNLLDGLERIASQEAGQWWSELTFKMKNPIDQQIRPSTTQAETRPTHSASTRFRRTSEISERVRVIRFDKRGCLASGDAHNVRLTIRSTFHFVLATGKIHSNNFHREMKSSNAATASWMPWQTQLSTDDRTSWSKSSIQNNGTSSELICETSNMRISQFPMWASETIRAPCSPSGMHKSLM